MWGRWSLKRVLSWRRAGFGVASGAASVLLLASCGGGGDEPSEASSAGAPAGAATAAGTGSAAATVVKVATVVATVVVRSSDGVGVMSFSEAALPEGVTRDAIQMVPIEQDAEREAGATPVLAAYALEPAGTRFLEPVTISVTISAEAAAKGVAVFHKWGPEVAEMAVISDVTYAEAAGGKVVASVEVDHFSEIQVTTTDFFSATAKAETDLLGFGDSLEVTVMVERATGWKFSFETKEGVIWIVSMDGQSWVVRGDFTAAGSIDPASVENLPPSARATGPTFSFREQFMCVGGGGVTVTWDGELVYQQRIKSETLSDETTLGPVVEFESAAAEFECVMPRISASAAPPITTYTLEPAPAAGLSSVQYQWSGADCGEVSGSTSSTMAWQHGGESCEHTTESHGGTMIAVFVSGAFTASGKSFEMRCAYDGAGSGLGLEQCALVK
jgi:hypothetical protein